MSSLGSSPTKSASLAGTPSCFERGLEEARVRFASADLRGIRADREEPEQAELLEVAVDDLALVDRVDDEPELHVAVAQRGERGDHVGGQFGVLEDRLVPEPAELAEARLVALQAESPCRAGGAVAGRPVRRR